MRTTLIGDILCVAELNKRALWLGLFTVIFGSLQPQAHAMTGFSLGYANITNWTLQAPPPIPLKKGEQSMLCPSDTELVACLSGLDADSGSVALNGSTSKGSTQWFVQNNTSQDYQVSFNWLYTNWSTDRENYATYQVGIVPGSGTEFRAQESETSVTLSLPSQHFITFAVHTLNKVNTSDDLTISNYNSTVPGPLPAAGAAASFAWSRRLRRRVAGKGEAPGRSNPLALARRPYHYLDQKPADRSKLLACFSYSILPVPDQTCTPRQEALQLYGPHKSKS